MEPSRFTKCLELLMKDVHGRLGFQCRIRMGLSDVQRLTPSLRLAGYALRAIHHVVASNRHLPRCCGEQNRNQRESMIRRRFVPPLFQSLKCKLLESLRLATVSTASMC